MMSYATLIVAVVFGHTMDSRWLKRPTPQMHNKAPESRNRKY